MTQFSARRILFELGLDRLVDPFDVSLRNWCSKPGPVCLSTLPQLFDHYRRSGPGDVDSDIKQPTAEFREKAFTNNIRWSVQLNMRKILDGDKNYDDQYPDTEADSGASQAP